VTLEGEVSGLPPNVGLLAAGSSTMLSTEPSALCMRVSQSSSHFTSSSTSGTPLLDSGML
jgi:hypothetical protein